MTDSNKCAEGIFQATLKFGSAGERNDFLDRICTNNVELRSKVENLLRLRDLTGDASSRRIIPATERISEKALQKSMVQIEVPWETEPIDKQFAAPARLPASCWHFFRSG